MATKGKGLREQARSPGWVWAPACWQPGSDRCSNLLQCLLLQDLSTLDAAKLTPLSPEVISRQATINIGACGSPNDSRVGALSREARDRRAGYAAGPAPSL